MTWLWFFESYENTKIQPEYFTNFLKKSEFFQSQIARKMDLFAGSKNVEKTFSESGSIELQ